MAKASDHLTNQSLGLNFEEVKVTLHNENNETFEMHCLIDGVTVEMPSLNGDEEHINVSMPGLTEGENISVTMPDIKPDDEGIAVSMPDLTGGENISMNIPDIKPADEGIAVSMPELIEGENISMNIPDIKPADEGIAVSMPGLKEGDNITMEMPSLTFGQHNHEGVNVVPFNENHQPAEFISLNDQGVALEEVSFGLTATEIPGFQGNAAEDMVLPTSVHLQQPIIMDMQGNEVAPEHFEGHQIQIDDMELVMSSNGSSFTSSLLPHQPDVPVMQGLHFEEFASQSGEGVIITMSDHVEAPNECVIITVSDHLDGGYVFEGVVGDIDGMYQNDHDMEMGEGFADNTQGIDQFDAGDVLSHQAGDMTLETFDDLNFDVLV